MAERPINTQTEDLFGGKKLNVTGIDPLLDGTENAVGNTGRFVSEHRGPLIMGTTMAATAALVTVKPVEAQSEAPNSEVITFLSDPTNVWGAVGGVLAGIEEAFEKGREKFGAKSLSILKKVAGGFAIGKTVSHMVINQNMDLANATIATGAAITLIEETSLSELFNNVKDGVVAKGKAISAEREYENKLRDLSALINAAHYRGNSRSKTETRNEAIARIFSEYHLGVYKRNKKGQVTGINEELINLLYDKMGPDHLLQEDEARDIFKRISALRTAPSGNGQGNGGEE